MDETGIYLIPIAILLYDVGKHIYESIKIFDIFDKVDAVADVKAKMNLTAISKLADAAGEDFHSFLISQKREAEKADMSLRDFFHFEHEVSI